MRLVYIDGEFREFKETKSLDNSGPHGFALNGVIPSVGDTIQHPHDADGYALGWIGRVAHALPKDLILDYGGGIDNDVYLIVEKEKEL